MTNYGNSLTCFFCFLILMLPDNSVNGKIYNILIFIFKTQILNYFFISQHDSNFIANDVFFRYNTLRFKTVDTLIMKSKIKMKNYFYYQVMRFRRTCPNRCETDRTKWPLCSQKFLS